MDFDSYLIKFYGFDTQKESGDKKLTTLYPSNKQLN